MTALQELVQSDKVIIKGHYTPPEYVVRYVSYYLLRGEDCEFFIDTDRRFVAVVDYDINQRYKIAYEDIEECQI